MIFGLGERVIDAELLELHEQVALAGEFADEDAAGVADERRIDVLIGAFILHHAGDVVARLVREGAGADVGRAGLGHEVREFRDVIRNLGQASKLLIFDDVETHFDLEVREDGEDIGVAAAFAVSVDAALHLPHAGFDGGEGVGDGEAGIVVEVDAEAGIADAELGGFDGGKHGASGHAAIGIAEDEGIGARAGGRRMHWRV